MADSIPLPVWQNLIVTHKKLVVDLPQHPGEVPSYAVCKFCGTMYVVEWVVPEDGEDFRAHPVSHCVTCAAFRKQFLAIDEMLRMVISNHLLWYGHEENHADQHDTGG